MFAIKISKKYKKNVIVCIYKKIRKDNTNINLLRFISDPTSDIHYKFYIIQTFKRA